MILIVGDFDSPSHRIRGDDKWRVAEFLHRGTKLFGFPGFNLYLVVFSVPWRVFRLVALVTRPSYGISNTRALNYPLLIVRYEQREEMVIHKPPPFSEVLGGTTTHFLRSYPDAEAGFILDALDIVDPWLQFSVLENGSGVARRVQDHS